MKKPSILTLLSIALLTTSCNGNNDAKKTVSVSMNAMVNANAKQYKVKAEYQDGFFTKSSDSLNKDLAMVSYLGTFAASNEKDAESFYSQLGFKKCYASTAYTATEVDENSIAYYVAHKVIKKTDTFVLSLRGYNYNQEWSNNFYLGSEGDHVGFTQGANLIMEEFSKYLQENYKSKSIKLWINGYSRAGGIANVLAHKIISSTTLPVKDENLFVYTYEAPQGLEKSNAIKYKNVFNFVNGADLITRIAPTAYGFARCGQDIDIYNSKVDGLLNNLDKDAYLPHLKTTDNYKNDIQLAEYLIESLTKDIGDKTMTLENRHYFVTNYQESIRYMLKIFFSFSEQTKNNMMNKFNKMTLIEKLALISKDGVYNFIKPFIEADGIPYDDSKLHTSCDKINLFLTGPGYQLRTILMSDPNTLMRAISMHYTEVNYVLLNDYRPQ